MVALIDHEVAVIGHHVVDLALAHQTLDHADIDDAARPARPAADPTDSGGGRNPGMGEKGVAPVEESVL